MPELESIEQAKEHFGALLKAQQARVDLIKTAGEPTDYTKLDTIHHRRARRRRHRTRHRP